MMREVSGASGGAGNHNPAHMPAFFSFSRWIAPLATVGVWALAAATAVFWFLRLAAPGEPAAPPAIVGPVAAPDTQAVAKALGAAAVGEALPDTAAGSTVSRFSLHGVALSDARRGAALIAVDGKPPRPYRVGEVVAENHVLQSVTSQAVALGTGIDAPSTITLHLPQRLPGAPRMAGAGGSGLEK